MNAAVSAAVAVQFRRTFQLLAVGGPTQVLYRDGEGFITAERLPVSERFRNPELLQHRGQKLADAGDAWEDRLAGVGHRGTTAAEVEE